MHTRLGSWELLLILTCAPWSVCNRDTMANNSPRRLGAGQHPGQLGWDAFDLLLGSLHAFLQAYFSFPL